MAPGTRARISVLLPFIILLMMCGNPSSNVSLTDAESVAADTATLQIAFAPGDSITSVTHSVTLPTLGPSGTIISWSSSQPVIMNATGALLQRPASPATVILTATVTKGSASDMKEFFLTVTAPNR